MTMNKKFIYISFAVLTAIITLGLIYFLLLAPGNSHGTLKCSDYNLLVFTLDTVRADHIGAYGHSNAQTPNVDSLAKNGSLFQNCYTSIPITLPSHCSIFTGKYPLGHAVRDNGNFYLDPSETTLAEIMKKQGFTTFAATASYVLLSNFGLNQGFDTYDDSLKPNEILNNFDSEITADGVYDKFEKWFDKEKNNKFFAWIHFYDAHEPYSPPDEFKKKFGTGKSERYDAEIAYVDFYLGKIIDRLKESGLLERTLIVIAGDHGEGFGEHNEFGHSLLCYEEALRVPLIFYNPSVINQGKTITSRVNLVDIMPTILDLYGIADKGSIQGQTFKNLLAGDTEKENRTTYIESIHGKEELGWAPITGIIKGNYKYLSVPEPELYDLAADKGEKENLFLKKNHLARALDKDLMAMVKTLSTPGKDDKGKRVMSDADKQHLQSLGYVSAFSDNTATNLDPKKGILVIRQFEEVQQLIDSGQLDSAKAKLEEMVKTDPRNKMPQYFGKLNDIYKKKNDTEGVIRSWKDAIAAFPKNDNFRINLALEFFNLQRLDESDRVAADIIKNDPKYTRAYIIKARIAEKQDKKKEALALYQKALEQEPHNTSLKLSAARLMGAGPQAGDSQKMCEELLADKEAMADPSTKARVGVMLAELNQDDRALPLLLETVQAGKDDAETWNYLGIVYYRKGLFEESLNAYKKSIEKDPKIAVTFNNLGTLYLSASVKNKSTEMLKQALTAFNRALELDPALIKALNGRGSLFSFVNRPREAISDWKKVLSIDPSFTDAYFNIGITYLALKSAPDALRYFQQCKEKYFNILSSRDQQRLDRLIAESGGHHE